MDDEVFIGWSIDPEIRTLMRLDRVRTAHGNQSPQDAVLEAEELLDEEPDNADGLFLLGESSLELGDFEGALLAYERHLELTEPRAESLLGLAIAQFNTCDLDGCIETSRQVIDRAPDLAEAHYYLGLALEHLEGTQSEALSELAAANQLDPVAFPFPLQIELGAWQDLIQRALVLLPQSLRTFWTDLPILLIDRPDLDELVEGDAPITPTVTGLYQGTPPEEGDPWVQRPEALRLYTGNLARSPSEEHLIDALARTFEHEARDWLGLGPEDPL